MNRIIWYANLSFIPCRHMYESQPASHSINQPPELCKLNFMYKRKWSNSQVDMDMWKKKFGCWQNDKRNWFDSCEWRCGVFLYCQSLCVFACVNTLVCIWYGLFAYEIALLEKLRHWLKCDQKFRFRGFCETSNAHRICVWNKIRKTKTISILHNLELKIYSLASCEVFAEN